MTSLYHSTRPISRRLLATILAAPLILSTAGCVDLARMLARPEAKTPEPKPQVAATPPEEAPAPIPAPQEKPKPGKLYEWNGKGQKLSRIVVNTDEQKARFYVGDEQVGWTTVASGVPKHATPVGHFEVIEKVANKRSNLYGKIYGKGGQVVRSDAKAGAHPVPAGARFEGAKMPYFLRLTYDGVGLHAGPIPRPGRPASHGCIRLPAKMAPVLFEHVGVGTKVSIVGKGPDYGNYAQKQRALAAERAAREKERREFEARAQAEALAGGPAAGAATTAGQGDSAAPTVASTSPAESAGTRSEPMTSEPVAPRARVAASPAPAKRRPTPRPTRRPAATASVATASPVASTPSPLPGAAATMTPTPTATPVAPQATPTADQASAAPAATGTASVTPAAAPTATAQPVPATVATAPTEAPKTAPAEAPVASAKIPDAAPPAAPAVPAPSAAAPQPATSAASPAPAPAPQATPTAPAPSVAAPAAPPQQSATSSGTSGG